MKTIIPVVAFTLFLACVPVQAHGDRAVAGAILGAWIGYQLTKPDRHPVPGYRVSVPSPVHVPHNRRACDTQRVPVYDQSGRLLEFRQFCR